MTKFECWTLRNICFDFLYIFFHSLKTDQTIYLSKKGPLTNATFFSFMSSWKKFLKIKSKQIKSKQIKTQIKSNHIKKYCVCNIQPSNFVTIKFIKWHAKDISWNKTEIFKNNTQYSYFLRTNSIKYSKKMWSKEMWPSYENLETGNLRIWKWICTLSTRKSNMFGMLTSK